MFQKNSKPLKRKKTVQIVFKCFKTLIKNVSPSLFNLLLMPNVVGAVVKLETKKTLFIFTSIVGHKTKYSKTK